MDSKQALRDLVFLAIGDESHTEKCKKVIEKDLEVLEILKSSIVYDEREIDRHKFMELSATIFDDDNINKIKEWLEK